MRPAVNLSDPLLWAVFMGWIMTVVLHELAHGVVAYWGGDYTIKERGGLTLNPFQYIDPVMSLLLPVVVFLLGGLPLPGGVTYVRRDLLRSRAWQAAVSAAGPAMNFLIFLALVVPFHPRLRWVTPPMPGQASNALLFVGAMAWLQILSVMLNLLPIPPLDGFGIISPLMDEPSRRRLMTPPLSIVLFLALFFLAGPLGLIQAFHLTIKRLMLLLGFDVFAINFFGGSYNQALLGHT
jgi:Zn-dependent protease